MDQWVSDVVGYITAHRAWAGPIVFCLAFAESMAFLSLFVPFTAMIVASGALIGAGTLDPWIVLPWGIAGASLGDAVSYWIGRYFGNKIPRIWPFRNHPELIEQGHRFFVRWGVLSVFLGRFFGPLRAIVPIVAGMMEMPQTRFQLANVGSAIVWLPVLMVPGAVAGTVFNNVSNFGEKAFGYVFIAFVVFPLAIGLIVWLCKRKRA